MSTFNNIRRAVRAETGHTDTHVIIVQYWSAGNCCIRSVSSDMIPTEMH